MSHLSVQVVRLLALPMCMAVLSQELGVLWKKKSFQLKHIKGSQDL